MHRVDCENIINALVSLRAPDVPGQVDGLINAYLMGWDPTQSAKSRAELAHEFLNTAPFTALSYRIWRRISSGADEDWLDREIEIAPPSMRFMPAVEFPTSR